VRESMAASASGLVAFYSFASPRKWARNNRRDRANTPIVDEPYGDFTSTIPLRRPPTPGFALLAHRADACAPAPHGKANV